MTARCDNQISSIGVCNTPLTVTTNGFGKTITVCRRCHWRANQRCWTCGQPRTNHPEFGVYCEPCRKAAVRAAWKSARRDPDKARKHRETYTSKPGYREKKNAALRAWREKNPEKAKAQWQRYIAKKKAQSST